MRQTLLISLLLLLLLAFGCNPRAQKPKPVLEDKEPNPTILENTPVPESAVFGDFNGDGRPFYAFVKKEDAKTQNTLVAFESEKQSQLLIPETLGAALDALELEGLDRDVLLVTAKLKDSNFNKYYLFVLREKQWKPLIDGFAIHKSNLSDTLVPVKANPEKPGELLRYYSGFEMDPDSEKKYRWVLLEESVPLENR